MSRSSRCRRALRGATPDELLVVRRRCGDPVRGFVVAVGRRWLLIRSCHLTELGALVAVRLDDAIDVVPDPFGGVVARALELRSELPVASTDHGKALDRTSTLLMWASMQFGCLTLFSERRFPTTRHVGIIVSVDSRAKRFTMSELGPDARWWPRPFRWRFRELRRIELDDRYARDLLAVAAERAVTRPEQA